MGIVLILFLKEIASRKYGHTVFIFREPLANPRKFISTEIKDALVHSSVKIRRTSILP